MSETRIGVGLVAIGLGWVVLTRGVAVFLEGAGIRIPTVPLLGLYLDATEELLEAIAVGIVYVTFGLDLIARAHLDRPARPSFREVLGTGMVAVGIVVGIVLHTPANGGPFAGTGVTEVVAAPQFYLGYFTVWLFAISIATTRRQRILGIAGLAAAPLGAVVFLAVLVATGGGWVMLAGIYILALSLGLFALSLVYALPLLVVGRALADNASSIPSDPETG